MTRRMLGLLVLASVAACGSGRLVPSDTVEPAAGPGGPAATTGVAPPAPGAEPTPQVAPTPGTGASGYAPGAGEAVQIRRIGQWTTSGMTRPGRLVIRDDSSYARFWAELEAGPRPRVDFTRDIVIAAAAGQQTTGGHLVAVERVTRAGEGLVVDVVETVPGQSCVTTQALTQPVDVVVVAAADAKTWSFSDQTRVQECQ